MAADARRIDRFALHQLIDDGEVGRFERGIDTVSGEPVVVQTVGGSSASLSRFVHQARLADRLGLAPRARLIAAGVVGPRAYAAYRIPEGARPLSSLLDGESGIPLSFTGRLSILAAIVAMVRRGIERGEPCVALSPETLLISEDMAVDAVGLVNGDFGSISQEERLRIETRRLVDVYGALMSGVLRHEGRGAPLPQGTEKRVASLASHFPAGGDPRPFALERFEAEIHAAIEALSSPSGAPGGADAYRVLPDIEPGAGKSAPETAESDTRVYDDNVQFTVYRPRTLTPGKWQPLLAFAHLAERRSEAAADEPDPASEVARQAKALLEDPSAFRHSNEDSAHAIPRDGEVSFVPTANGAEFNPRSCAFRWTESVHRADFRVRALPGAGPTIHGRMSVYLGALLLAEINVSFAVGESEPAVPVASSAAPYRRIFASYSHKDTAIVQQCRDYAKAMGDRYLQDVFDLRSGERWLPALEQLIRDADVFQLFWSWHALESPYVQHEWRFALSLNRASFVRPVYWDTPLPSRGGLPPEELLALQFAQISGWKPAAAVPVAVAPVPDVQTPTPAADTAHPTPQLPVPTGRSNAATPSAPRSTRGRRIPWNAFSIAAALLLAVVVAQRTLRPDAPIAPRPVDSAAGGASPAPAATSSLIITVASDPQLSAERLDAVVLQVVDLNGRIAATAPLGPDRTARFSNLRAGRSTVDVATTGMALKGRPQLTIVGGTSAPVRIEIALQ